MIHHLQGRLVEKHPTHVVVECGGVGYMVAISLTTYDQLGDRESVKILTHMVVREDAHLLFGFATEGERALFLQLLGVNGVGANTARLILSAMDAETAASAIAQGDVDAMKRVKGIGAKTAQRIIVDLQDKVGASGPVGGVGQISSGPHNTMKADALGALTSLGFDKAKCNKVLDDLLASQGNSATLEGLIKAALREL
ncbi:MAG: Holliday junction branch migration protein RuvA [Bacteroidetes bacterium]|jgi:Holliday junction DNA helicase RuvA|nr:Holliday junction branch migration protein RuvA [Bacteroidota bacterium]